MSDQCQNQSLEEDLPCVSVLIITRGRREILQLSLDSLARLDYPHEKMQVVVLEETDDPVPPEVDCAEYHSIPVQERGFGHARNRALEYARHPLVVFVDDDCKMDPAWLRELVDPLVNEQDVAATCGAVKIPASGPVGESESILGFPGGGVRFLHEANGRLLDRGTFSTCSCAVRKDVLEAVGGFDERLQFGGEDESVSRAVARHGRIVYNPRAIVFHAPRDNLRKVFSWFIRRGRARINQLSVSDNPRSVRYSIVRNSAIVRAVVLICLALLFGLPVLPILLAFYGLYYALTLWRFRWARAFYPSLKTYLALPFVKSVMDLGMDTGILLASWSRLSPGFTDGHGEC